MRSIICKAKEQGVDLSLENERARAILEQIKMLENRGFQYDGAEASFDLLVWHTQPDYHPPFELIDFMVIIENRRRPPTIKPPLKSEISAGDKSGGELLSEATVKVKVGGDIVHAVAEGNGPVNALDRALRKALLQFYPELVAVKLLDYKVRILEQRAGTESQIRVLIESSDGKEEWTTVGSSTNIIEASWLALADSLEYWLVENRRYPK
jgi:2-isopropylmalate synthase